jgi:imidazolonepropionase-like amidohydrolase
VRDCGVDPMAAMVSANSLGAEALGLGDQIGSIAPGFQADIIALDGDPLKVAGAVNPTVFEFLEWPARSKLRLRPTTDGISG